ncbi:MAG: hypothetical protein GY826_12655, partial [Fuerstiella sp.]|nr:hypothetical protein [Fuerstiella sp.]
MKRRSTTEPIECESRRRGSTLLIVLALLGLLAFTGMVFYTFSAQERAAAEYFSEAAKSAVDVPDDPFPWAVQQILTGANDNQKRSILWSPRRRHAMLQNVVGYDTVAHSDTGINVEYVGGLPTVVQDLDNDGTTDMFATGGLNNPINYVDSLVAWGGAPFGVDEPGLYGARGANASVAGPFPAPGVDYTYPDINNIFLAHRGWAIRDNGAAHLPADERYERVPVFIPSFMRPALLKSSTANGPGGTDALMNEDWYDHSTATGHSEFSVRSMRPSEHHIAGFTSAGDP